MPAQPSLRLALCHPDQPGNFGAMLRLTACLGVDLDVIEPCGFPLDARRIKRAAIDYADAISYRTHSELERFVVDNRAAQRRLVLLSARAHEPYHRFAFAPNDTLVLGSESRGAPPSLEPDAALRIPMREGLRSLNVVTAAAMVLGEALRQLDSWPAMDDQPKAI